MHHIHKHVRDTLVEPVEGLNGTVGAVPRGSRAAELVRTTAATGQARLSELLRSRLDIGNLAFERVHKH